MAPTALVNEGTALPTAFTDGAATAKSTVAANGNDIQLSSKDVMHLEHEYGAHNYHPLPVVFEKASGAHVWDPEGKMYIDMLSAYSAVNQGHCHPRIVAALVDQASKLTLSSRAFYNSVFGQFARKITSLFGYDMVLPMNTGAEAVESALKLARKWGYKVKGIPDGKARVLAVENNFHGRTIGIVSMSSDPEATTGFGPFLDRVGPVVDGDGETLHIRYNNLDDLERVLDKYGHEVAAFLVEPIQGEAGIVVPSDGYLAKAHDLCKKHNVLLICDEIQTGLGRTGKLLCCYHDNVKPDMVLLGKALSGGLLPVSAVLADKDVMLCIQPGEHGSTYGGNPLGSAVAITALDVLVEEDLSARADRLGQKLRSKLVDVQRRAPMLKEVRGRGLLIAIVIDESKSIKKRSAWQVCLLLKSKGLLAKPTHRNIIRLAPPLVISEEDLDKAAGIIEESLLEIDTLESVPGDSAEEHNHVEVLED